METGNGDISSTITEGNSNYNRVEELKAFDDTKTGVKGLVDSGLLKVPNIFIEPSEVLVNHKVAAANNLQLPVIDLQGEHDDLVRQIKDASLKWGFFQVVNHGVPISMCNEMLDEVIRFNEEDDEVKKKYYSRDMKQKVKFNSSYDLFRSKAANWRDTLSVDIVRSEVLDPLEIPSACRDTMMEYSNQVFGLGDRLFELLSEALGLQQDHLKQMNCCESCLFACHYYPTCPQPELTLGLGGHTDAAYLTILLQDDTGGLQVLHQDQWVDVTPVPGAFIINIGDLLQVLSNDKLRSVKHRVMTNQVKPRVSVVFLLTGRFDIPTKPFGPIKELISDDSAPIYGQYTCKDYLDHFFSESLHGKRGLESFKLQEGCMGYENN